MTGYTFNQLFDFTRTTAGTFVGSNGLLQTTPASVNLLTFTQEFDNAAWVNSIGGTGTNPTISANTGVAPDGTPTADRLQFSLGGGTTLTDLTRRIQNYSTLGSTTYTFSVYLRSFDGSSTYNMHLVGADGVTTSIVVTGVWQRFTITTSRVGVATVGYAIGLRGGLSPANSNTADVLAWGAQLELGSTATTYARNNGGLFPPRFDYDPVTLAPRGILIEEQRTNLATYSDQFDNAVWTKLNATVTANATASPDGAVNADKLAEDAAAGVGHLISQGPTLTAVAHTYSVYAKASERNWICLLNNSIANALAFFNLATGTIGTVGSGATATITNVGNGWYRCSITFTAIAATNNCHIRLAPSDNVLTYNGVAGSGAFIYGAQLEAGAFATSYIPTVASQVTRTADGCAITAPMFAPWYVQNAGTFVIEFQALFSGATSTTVFGLTADANVSKRFFYIGAGSDQASTFDGTTIVTAAGDITGPVVKVASVYDASGRAIVSNGGAVASGAVAAGYSTASSLNIGNFGGNSGFGHIRRVTYYPFRASNNQLQALTT